MTTTYSTPGVYYEPRPRAEPRALARTDIAGFIGFETRFRDGSLPCQLLGTVPTGHSFQVDVGEFQLARGLLGQGRARISNATNLSLSRSDSSIPMPPGGSVCYTIAATIDASDQTHLFVLPGPVSTTEKSAPATDLELASKANGDNCLRMAHVEVRRTPDGSRVFPVIVPRLPLVRCDDWTDFVLQLGGLTPIDDGTFLARAVRAYFANGGARCHVATVRRPRFDDPKGLSDAVNDLIGIAGDSEREATGLEQLLRKFEVAIVDVPDLYSRRVDAEPQTVSIPADEDDACFRSCDRLAATHANIPYRGTHNAGAPLVDDETVLDAQKRMIVRSAPERWRVLLLLTAPVALDPADGFYHGPDASRSMDWRRQLDQAVDDLESSVAAFYHPWPLTQESLGAPVIELPPTGFAAGIIARRDLARGPQVSPANERVIGAVGLGSVVDEDINAAIYESPLNINPMRAFPGRGIELWGARTLSGDRWLRFLSVRRCLSAIERRAVAALRPLVFEPIQPSLWFEITQAMLSILMPIYNAGALRGNTPEEAFFVRCDETNNPPDLVLAGQVLCEVGVAIAAPAEFIVFRVGRREALVEVSEAP